MINVSNACRDKIRANSKVIGVGNIDFANSEHLELSGADFMANTIGYSQASSSTSSFDIGAAIIGKMTFSLNNYNGKFNSYDFTGSQITSWIGVPLESTTELIKKGVFNIQQPDSYGTTIALTAYDNMSKFQKPYSEVSTSYPATLQVIVADICLYCDVQIATPHFDNYTYSIPTRPDDKSMSCLDMIAYVAQIAGCFAVCNTNGRLVLKWYNTSSLNALTLSGGIIGDSLTDVVDGGDFLDYSQENIFDGGNFADEYYPIRVFAGLTISTDDVVITGIKAIANDDDSEHLYGDSGYVLEASGNPLITSTNAAYVAEYLGLKIIGIRFRPFSLQAQSDPTIEPGDACFIFDKGGNIYRAPATSINYKIGSRTSLACNAETPARNKAAYYSQLAKTAARVKQTTKRELSNYDKQVQAMNQLAANAMGFYTTYEDMPDGSRITYIHDKPTIAESMIVYKETIDGFFLSQDGGETYIYGRDSSGNVIVNILSAVGILFDWAKGGTLTLGGDNDVSGVAVVLDEDGEECVRLDKGGLKTHSAEITGGKVDISTSDGDNAIALRSTNNSAYISPGTVGVGRYVGGNLVDTVTLNPSWLYFGSTNYHSRSELMIGSSRVNSTQVIAGSSYMSSAYVNAPSAHATFASLNVTGAKTRVVSTANYDRRLLYCYETPKPYFGDIGEAVLDETGICYIQIDDIFYETVNTSCNYQVFLQKNGQGDLWIKERTPTRFIVEGTPNLSFAWELKARQAGFEYERLDKFEKPSDEQVIDYELEAINYVTNFYKEMERV